MAAGGPDQPGVFVHIVTFNSADNVLLCIRSILDQRGYDPGTNLEVRVTDNSSENGIADLIEREFGGTVSLHRNSSNLGFCGAHNQGAADFLSSAARYFLVLNPDVRLEPDALGLLCAAAGRRPDIGLASPRLYRADERLQPLREPTLDAAGMYMTPALRHFDRGSNLPDGAEYASDCFVFGGSGACLLIGRECVEDLILSGRYESDTEELYPQLAAGREERCQLFDEAFFAYREDAELAWRAQSFGWRCVYAASAKGYHKRVVLATNRAELSPDLNLLGVRNRFLLQMLHYYPGYGAGPFVSGIIARNALVAAGVLLKERSSLPALRQLKVLRRRAGERRAMIASRSKVSPRELSRWFKATPVVEAFPSTGSGQAGNHEQFR